MPSCRDQSGEVTFLVDSPLGSFSSGGKASVPSFFISGRSGAPRLLRLVAFGLLGVATAVLGIVFLALHNVTFLRFLRVIWQGIQIFPPRDFRAKPVDPATGFLLPRGDLNCRAWVHTDHHTFQQCAPELLWAAATTVPPLKLYSPRGANTTANAQHGAGAGSRSPHAPSSTAKGRGLHDFSSLDDGVRREAIAAAEGAGRPDNAAGADEIKNLRGMGWEGEGTSTSTIGSVEEASDDDNSTKVAGSGLDKPLLYSETSGAATHLPAAATSAHDEEQQQQQTLNFSNCAVGSPLRNLCPVEWVSYLTNCNHLTNRMARAVHSTGVPFTVLGLGTFWKERWGLRLRLLHDHIVGMPEEKLVIATDSMDVLPVPWTTPELVAERYAKLVEAHEGPRVFFDAEIVCFPKPQLWYRFPDPETIPGGNGYSPFRCLNAGVMVGPVGLVRRLIELVYQDECYDDQMLYSFAAVDPIMWWVDPVDGEPRVASTTASQPGTIPSTAKPLIGLDHWNYLAIDSYATRDDEFLFAEGGKGLEYTVTQSRPLIVHQSGEKSESDLLDIMSMKFGYADFPQPRP